MVRHRHQVNTKPETPELNADSQCADSQNLLLSWVLPGCQTEARRGGARIALSSQDLVWLVVDYIRCFARSRREGAISKAASDSSFGFQSTGMTLACRGCCGDLCFNIAADHGDGHGITMSRSPASEIIAGGGMFACRHVDALSGKVSGKSIQPSRLLV